MKPDLMHVCDLLTGSGDAEVLGVNNEPGEPPRTHVGRTGPRPSCEGCRWAYGVLPPMSYGVPFEGSPNTPPDLGRN